MLTENKTMFTENMQKSLRLVKAIDLQVSSKKEVHLKGWVSERHSD